MEQRASQPVADDVPVRDVNDKVPHELRPAAAGDAPFVLDSWRRSYGDAQNAHAPSLETYIRAQRRVIEQCLSTSETAVAHWPGEPDHILGWVCYRPGPKPVVHYLFVKQLYRGRGLGRALLDHAVGDANQLWTTHARKLGIWRRRITFCPALIFD